MVILSNELAELFGMHAGDGTIYRTRRGLVYELRGGKDEKEFYNTHVMQLCKKISTATFTANERSGGKNGCYGIRTCNKDFIQTFVKAGFPIGSKSLIVSIPAIVMMGPKEVKASFLRGLFATDGTAYLAKINRNKIATYPIIELASISRALRDKSRHLLDEFELKSSIWTYKSDKYNDLYFIRLSGKQKCKKFVDEVGLSNPKHLTKIKHNI